MHSLFDVSLSICILRLELTDYSINCIDLIIFVDFDFLPEIGASHPLMLNFLKGGLIFINCANSYRRSQRIWCFPLTWKSSEVSLTNGSCGPWRFTMLEVMSSCNYLILANYSDSRNASYYFCFPYPSAFLGPIQLCNLIYFSNSSEVFKSNIYRLCKIISEVRW